MEKSIVVMRWDNLLFFIKQALASFVEFWSFGKMKIRYFTVFGWIYLHSCFKWRSRDRKIAIFKFRDRDHLSIFFNRKDRRSPSDREKEIADQIGHALATIAAPT